MSLSLNDCLKLLEGGGQPELGPGPRDGALPISEVDRQLNPLFKASQLSLTRQELIRALIYLWHDHLDESHSISQGIENPDGSFVHGIMHRREPDYSNAKYWFRRVGNHPSFRILAERAEPLLTSAPDLRKRLLPSGKWDSFAFIDECEAAAHNRANIFREIQAAESKILLEQFLAKE